jgi:hypothetical protein
MIIRSVLVARLVWTPFLGNAAAIATIRHGNAGSFAYGVLQAHRVAIFMPLYQADFG